MRHGRLTRLSSFASADGSDWRGDGEMAGCRTEKSRMRCFGTRLQQTPVGRSGTRPGEISYIQHAVLRRSICVPLSRHRQNKRQMASQLPTWLALFLRQNRPTRRLNLSANTLQAPPPRSSQPVWQSANMRLITLAASTADDATNSKAGARHWLYLCFLKSPLLNSSVISSRLSESSSSSSPASSISRIN